MNNILELKSLSKSFIEYKGEFYRLFSWFGINVQNKKEHKILDNISFSIKKGEAVGIIGQNGAGKSTLLKIITGTLKQSSGELNVTGKISAILELGMGFNPDLTGRQNVYHSAGLMGYTIKQINSVISEIENFAEIGEYFDQPVRLYSSGMQMRVAFSVATAFRPEVLIVDEALSVGDTYFQHKSFERIRNFQSKGTSLLLVSHDKAAIQGICTRAILLEKGKILKDDKPEAIMDYYNALIADKENNNITQKKDNKGVVSTVSGTGEATIESIKIFDMDNKIVNIIGVGTEIRLNIRVKVCENIDELVIGYMIKDRLGQDIYGTNTYHLNEVKYDLRENDMLEYNFYFPMNLGEGSYSITIALHKNDTHVINNYEWRDKALMFSVVNINQKQFSGCSWLPPKMEYKSER